MRSTDKEKASFKMKNPPVRQTTRAHTCSHTGMVWGARVFGIMGGVAGFIFFPDFTVDLKLSAILKILSGVAIGVLFGGPIGGSIGSLFHR